MPLIKITDCENCHIDHEWIFDAPKLSELRMIKTLTGLSQKAFAEAGDEGDPDALAALIYVLHMRDKIKIPFDKIELDFRNFSMEPTEQEQKEIDALLAAESDEDPKEEMKPESGPTKKAASKRKS